MGNVRAGSKEVRNLIRQLEQNGCDVARNKQGHWRVVRPGYRPITLTSTSSDHRWMLNARADIRRNLGLDVSI